MISSLLKAAGSKAYFGIIPKHKCRLIVDLSYPPGGSVNDKGTS